MAVFGRSLTFGIETLRNQWAWRKAEAKARLLSSAIEQTADLVTFTDAYGVILLCQFRIRAGDGLCIR